MSDKVEFEFKSEEIESGEEGISPFQQELANEILNVSSPYKFIFVEAPTGAGKTYSFILPVLKANISSIGFNPHIMIAEPTREIISDLERNIQIYVNGYNEIHPSEKRNVSVAIITGETQVQEGDRQHQIYNAVVNNDVVIMTPDILSLYVAGNYVRGTNEWKLRKSTNFQDPLSQLSAIIFDEYHTYDPESLGRILSVATIAVKAKFPKLKFIFPSATPSEKFKGILEDVLKNIAPDSIKTIPASTLEEKGIGRKMRGRLKLVITSEDISNTVDEVKNFLKKEGNKKMLYIFNSVVESERFADSLKKNGITPKIVNGFHTDQSGSNERIIVATSTMELGVNISDNELGHIEPGYYFESLSQRLGRFSRGVQDSTVYLHVDDELLNEFKRIKTDRYYDFLKEVSKIVQAKYIHESTVRYNSRIFTYCVYRNTHREGLRDHIRDALLVLKGERLLAVDDVLHVVEKCEGDYRDKEHFIQWWRDYFRAYGYFRGAISNVRVRLPERGETEYDYIWILNHTDFRMEGDTYVIERWRDTPRKPSVSYKGFLSENEPVTFKWEEIWKDGGRKFKEKWYEALDDALEKLNLSEEQSKKCSSTLKEALSTIQWKLLPVKKFPPSEVNQADFSIFI